MFFDVQNKEEYSFYHNNIGAKKQRTWTNRSCEKYYFQNKLKNIEYK